MLKRLKVIAFDNGALTFFETLASNEFLFRFCLFGGYFCLETFWGAMFPFVLRLTLNILHRFELGA